MNTFFRFVCFFLSSCLVHAASINVSLSSQFLARGEQAVLEVILSDIEPPETLRIPAMQGVSLQARGFGGPNAIILPGRKLGYVYQFQLSSFEVGKHKIPSISVSDGNQTYESLPLEFEVFDAAQLRFSELRVGSDTIPYAAFFRSAKTSPYVGEIIPVEMKIYFPANIRIEEWGIPDFDRDSITAWRFEPRPQIGNVIMLGSTYQCVSYPSTMAATRSGKVSIGPAKIRLISVQNVMGRFGFEQNAIPLNLQAEVLNLDALPLPEGAPAGFLNAVGSFALTARAEETQVREGDPLNVILTVEGRGNLDSLDVPKLEDPEGWKLYEASRNEMGEARRQLEGLVTFNQFMRPTKRQTVIPPFRLVYFDPSSASYKIASSSPIPLKVLPSTNPGGGLAAMSAVPQAADTPVEMMTDILGIIQGAAPLQSPGDIALPHLWHLVPLVIVLTLVFSIFHRHFLPRLQASQEEIRRREAWRALQKTQSDRSEFLRSAGRFIEIWLPHHGDDPQLRQILKERDENCFLPASADAPMPPNRRQEILRTLRKLAFAIALLSLTFAQQAVAEEAQAVPPDAETLYQQGDYKEAIAAWLAAAPYEELSASTLYNIGNACYRAGSQGQAALYFRRALHADPQLEEARQNLRFLERKFGALTIKRPNYQYTLTKIPEAWINNLLLGCGWLIAISLLIFPATHQRSQLRMVSISCLIFCPFLLLAGGLAKHYYPDDSLFAPYAEQAVIVADQTTVYTDASRTSGQVIEVPAGSLCRIIRRSDKWVYIAFATQTRGWVTMDRIEPLIPTEQPTVPDFSAPAEDNRSSA